MTEGVKYLVPVDTTLGNTTLQVDSTIPLWNTNTQYQRQTDGGATFVRTAKNRVFVYESDETNAGTDPDAEYEALINPFAPNPSPRRWGFVRMTRPHLLNDMRPSLVATASGETIEVVFYTSQLIDTIAFINIEASAVKYEFTRDGETHTKTVEFDDINAITNYFEYFFNPFTPTTQFVLRDIPLFSHPSTITPASAQMKITITNAGGVAKCGQIVMGREEEIGIVDADTIDGAEIDLSSIERDAYGQVMAVARNTIGTLDFEIVYDRRQTQFLKDLHNRFRGATPLVISLDDDEDLGLIIYGFIASFSYKPIAGSPTLARASYTIESLI